MVGLNLRGDSRKVIPGDVGGMRVPGGSDVGHHGIPHIRLYRRHDVLCKETMRRGNAYPTSLPEDNHAILSYTAANHS